MTMGGAIYNLVQPEGVKCNHQWIHAKEHTRLSTCILSLLLSQ
uniref:Uncharacterized protein n=1 Tax=Arundo donax TaxID=35708 RepID=A0A0A8ZI42_ARUDO